MKKKYIISILIILIISLCVFGFTYAYINSITNKINTTTTSGRLDVNYVEPAKLMGSLKPAVDKTGGLTATAKVNLKQGSIPGKFNMYITPTEFNNLNIDAFKWEVEGLRGGQVVYTNSGNFKNVSINTKMKIVDSYVLTNVVTTFNIYIWLDGSLITTSLNNVLFQAKINADSVPITGQM